MRSTSIQILAGLMVWGALSAGSAFAQEHTASWLTAQLAAQAHREADQARVAHHPDQAKIWEQWAGMYAKLGQDPLAPYLSALQFTQQNATGCTQYAAQLSSAGSKTGAALYKASAAFWTDLSVQLQAHPLPKIRFPKKEMLTPVPGLKGTPWERAGPPVQTAPRQIHATAADCAMLTQRARSCEQMMSTQLHQSAIGQGGDDFSLVMKRHECNQAEELYVAAYVSKK